MSKRVKRWRLSDVVRAMSRAAGDPESTASWLADLAADVSSLQGVEHVLRVWHLTFPRLLRTDAAAWDAMTNAEREALVVAEARRLKVPRRA